MGAREDFVGRGREEVVQAIKRASAAGESVVYEASSTIASLAGATPSPTPETYLEQANEIVDQIFSGAGALFEAASKAVVGDEKVTNSSSPSET